MKRFSLPSLALLTMACSLALPLMVHATAKHAPSHSHTVTTYADSMQTQRDGRQLHLRSSSQGVVVELAQPSPLIALMTGDIIRFVDGLRVDRVQTLADAVRRSKGSRLVFAVERKGQSLQVNVSAKDCTQWMTSEPPPQTAR